MGWRIVDTGFQVVLAAGIPPRARPSPAGCRRIPRLPGVDAQRGVSLDRAHGRTKVLQATETALELPPRALARSWESLANVGNLSSASVLFVAADLLESGAAQPGDVGLVVSMGPGFRGELVLLQW